MNSSKKIMLFLLFAVVVLVGVVFGALSATNGTASAGDGVPEHFVTAKLLDSTPVSGDIVTVATLDPKENSTIHRTIDEAVTNDTYVSTRVNDTEYERIQLTLDTVPEYQHGGKRNGLLVEKNGTVVRVQYLTAIPA